MGILRFIASDRTDVQFATQLLAQKLSGPTVPAMAGIKHIVHYLLDTKDWSYYFPSGGDTHEMFGTSESN